MIDLWADTSKCNLDKIDKLIFKDAKIILRRQNHGKTTKWMLNQLGWLMTNQTYKLTVKKLLHKLLNTKNNHYFSNYFKMNRCGIKLEEKKAGNHKVVQKNVFRKYMFLKHAFELDVFRKHVYQSCLFLRDNVYVPTQCPFLDQSIFRCAGISCIQSFYSVSE